MSGDGLNIKRLINVQCTFGFVGLVIFFFFKLLMVQPLTAGMTHSKKSFCDSVNGGGRQQMVVTDAVKMDQQRF